jgi:hypothetical protein
MIRSLVLAIVSRWWKWNDLSRCALRLSGWLTAAGGSPCRREAWPHSPCEPSLPHHIHGRQLATEGLRVQAIISDCSVAGTILPENGVNSNQSKEDRMRGSAFLMSVPVLLLALPALSQGTEVRTGTAAFGDWRTDAPGVRRLIKASDVPAPATGTDPEASIGITAKVVQPPQGALPKVPDGFAVQVFATGFNQPRTLRVAPNGDIFLAESGSGRVLVFRASAGSTPAKPEVFAENLDRPYGIAFHPSADPQYVYVATANQVVRYPYRSGDAKAAGPAEVIVDNIPTERHWTRDLAVSPGRQEPVPRRRLGVKSGGGWHTRHDAREYPAA